MATSEGEKQCPFCREWIPYSAARCRFCRAVLPESEGRERSPRQSSAIQEGAGPPPLPPAQRVRRDREDDFEDEPRRRRRRRGPEHGPYAECPHCGCPGFAERVSFTWWGGFVGPSMINHVRCMECGACYNGRTGRDNTAAITIYTIVSPVICVVLFGVIFW